MAKIFISYAREDYKIAEAIKLILHEDGHEVFFDAALLTPRDAFHTKIRDELRMSDLIIFLMSPQFFEPGRNTLTELRLAKEFFPQASGKVLPVKLPTLQQELVDGYLANFSWLVPAGLIETEVAAAANRLLPEGAKRGPVIENVEKSMPKEPFFLSVLTEIGESFFRGLTGTVTGLLLTIAIFFQGGCLVPILLAVFLSFCGKAYIGVGLSIGMISLICGCCGYSAAESAGRKKLRNELRSGITGAASGAATGAIFFVVFTAISTDLKFFFHDIFLFIGIQAEVKSQLLLRLAGVFGAVFGAVFGVVGTQFNEE